MLGGQGLGDQWRLRRGLNLIQVPGRFRLGHELLQAFVECALDHQIGTAAVGAAGIVKRGPFSDDGRRQTLSERRHHPLSSSPRSQKGPQRSQGGLLRPRSDCVHPNTQVIIRGVAVGSQPMHKFFAATRVPGSTDATPAARVMEPSKRPQRCAKSGLLVEQIAAGVL